MQRLGESVGLCSIVFEKSHRFESLVSDCEHFIADMGTLINKLYEKYPDM